ncbi:hypothetical protein GF342_03125 [Candidatus Woesearchaeota archaeon]|nr:hypothetical protein [Candidatus Woesearchaeota archaeon]
MKNTDLERVVRKRIEPLVNNTIRDTIGISLPQLSSDITDRLKQNPRFVIDTSVPFKEAKRLFKKYFLQKLLCTFGSVTEVSRIAGIKRESLHRLIKQLDIIAETDFRQYMKHEAIKSIIADCVDTYKHSLHPARVDSMYEKIPRLTEDIVRELPEEQQSLHDAEEDFERSFLRQALAENNSNISKTARRIGLRFETLHRKIKKLGL